LKGSATTKREDEEEEEEEEEEDEEEEEEEEVSPAAATDPAAPYRPPGRRVPAAVAEAARLPPGSGRGGRGAARFAVTPGGRGGARVAFNPPPPAGLAASPYSGAAALDDEEEEDDDGRELDDDKDLTDLSSGRRTEATSEPEEPDWEAALGDDDGRDLHCGRGGDGISDTAASAGGSPPSPVLHAYEGYYEPLSLLDSPDEESGPPTVRGRPDHRRGLRRVGSGRRHGHAEEEARVQAVNDVVANMGVQDAVRLVAGQAATAGLADMYAHGTVVAAADGDGGGRRRRGVGGGMAGQRRARPRGRHNSPPPADHGPTYHGIKSYRHTTVDDEEPDNNDEDQFYNPRSNFRPMRSPSPRAPTYSVNRSLALGSDPARPWPEAEHAHAASALSDGSGNNWVIMPFDLLTTMAAVEARLDSLAAREDAVSRGVGAAGIVADVAQVRTALHSLIPDAMRCLGGAKHCASWDERVRRGCTAMGGQVAILAAKVVLRAVSGAPSACRNEETAAVAASLAGAAHPAAPAKWDEAEARPLLTALVPALDRAAPIYATAREVSRLFAPPRPFRFRGENEWVVRPLRKTSYWYATWPINGPEGQPAVFGSQDADPAAYEAAVPAHAAFAGAYGLQALAKVLAAPAGGGPSWALRTASARALALTAPLLHPKILRARVLEPAILLLKTAAGAASRASAAHVAAVAHPAALGAATVAAPPADPLALLADGQADKGCDFFEDAVEAGLGALAAGLTALSGAAAEELPDADPAGLADQLKTDLVHGYTAAFHARASFIEAVLGPAEQGGGGGGGGAPAAAATPRPPAPSLLRGMAAARVGASLITAATTADGLGAILVAQCPSLAHGPGREEVEHARTARAVDWLRRSRVIARLLGANLHHRDHAAEVGALLRAAAPHGGVDGEVVDAMWAAAVLSADVSPDERAAAQSLLASSVSVLPPEQRVELQGRIRAAAEGGGDGGAGGGAADDRDARGRAARALNFLAATAREDAAGSLATFVLCEALHLAADCGRGGGEEGDGDGDGAGAAALAGAVEVESFTRGALASPWHADVPLGALIGWRRAAAVAALTSAAGSYVHLEGATARKGSVSNILTRAACLVWGAGGAPGTDAAADHAASGSPPRSPAARLAALAVVAAVIKLVPGGKGLRAKAAANTRLANYVAFDDFYRLGNAGVTDLVSACVRSSLEIGRAADVELKDMGMEGGTTAAKTPPSTTAPLAIPLPAAVGVARAAHALAYLHTLLYYSTHNMKTSALIHLWDVTTGWAGGGGGSVGREGPTVTAVRGALLDLARESAAGLQSEIAFCAFQGSAALLCTRLCADGSGGRPRPPVATATTAADAEEEDHPEDWVPPDPAAAEAAAAVAATDLGATAWALFLACFDAVGVGGDWVTGEVDDGGRAAMVVGPKDFASGRHVPPIQTADLALVAGRDQLWRFATASPDADVRDAAADRLVALHTRLAPPPPASSVCSAAASLARAVREAEDARHAADAMFEECIARAGPALSLLLAGGHGGGEHDDGDYQGGGASVAALADAASSLSAHLAILTRLARLCNTASVPPVRPHAYAGRAARMFLYVVGNVLGQTGHFTTHSAATVADVEASALAALGLSTVGVVQHATPRLDIGGKGLGPPGSALGYGRHLARLHYTSSASWVAGTETQRPTPADQGRATCPATAAANAPAFVHDLLRLTNAGRVGMGEGLRRQAVHVLDALPTSKSMREALASALAAGGGAGEVVAAAGPGDASSTIAAVLRGASNAGVAAAAYVVECLHALLFPAHLEAPNPPHENPAVAAAKEEEGLSTSASRMAAVAAGVPTMVVAFAETVSVGAGKSGGVPAYRLCLAAIRLATALLFETGNKLEPVPSLVQAVVAAFGEAGGGGRLDVMSTALARMALRCMTRAAGDAFGCGWEGWDAVTANAAPAPAAALVAEAGLAVLCCAATCPALSASLTSPSTDGAGLELAFATKAALTCAFPGLGGHRVRQWGVRGPPALARAVLPRPAGWVNLVAVLGEAAPWGGKGGAPATSVPVTTAAAVARAVSQALLSVCGDLKDALPGHQAATRLAAEACLGGALARVAPPAVLRLAGEDNSSSSHWSPLPAALLAPALHAAAALVEALGVVMAAGGGSGEATTPPPSTPTSAPALATTAPALVSYLLRGLLFPEAALVAGRWKGGAPVPAPSLVSALGGDARITRAVRCPGADPAVRAAAFHLVSALADLEPAAAAAAASALADLHCPAPRTLRLDAAPDAARGDGSAGLPPAAPALRLPGHPAGLANAAATCYMNATLQVMCARPAVRAALLASAAAGPLPGPNELKGLAAPAPAATAVLPGALPPPPPPPPPPSPTGADSVAHQLAVVFGHLSLGARAEHKPRAFWDSLRDLDGAAVDLREHQDACEFFTRLLDGVDAEVEAAVVREEGQAGTVPGPAAPLLTAPCRDPARKPLEACLGGALVMQTTCRPFGHVSQRVEPFAALSLDVAGKASLSDSLAAYVAAETMAGDNAVECEGCGAGARVEAARGARLARAALPGTLAIHLKRFEFDTRTYDRYKITSRYTFTDALDLAPYVDDAGGRGGGRVSTQFRLVGVIIHSGTAHAGHYYTLLALTGADAAALDLAWARGVDGQGGEEATGASPPSSPDDRRWFKYDDGTVTPWHLDDLDGDCFGGPTASTLVRGDRPYSAYMLFYERVDEEEETKAEGAEPMDVGPHAPSTWWAPPLAGPALGGLATLPVPPALATSGPALLDALLASHVADVAAVRALDPALPSFVKALLEKAGAAASRKPRRLSPAGNTGFHTPPVKGAPGGAAAGPAPPPALPTTLTIRQPGACTAIVPYSPSAGVTSSLQAAAGGSGSGGGRPGGPGQAPRPSTSPPPPVATATSAPPPPSPSPRWRGEDAAEAAAAVAAAGARFALGPLARSPAHLRLPVELGAWQEALVRLVDAHPRAAVAVLGALLLGGGSEAGGSAHHPPLLVAALTDVATPLGIADLGAAVALAALVSTLKHADGVGGDEAEADDDAAMADAGALLVRRGAGAAADPLDAAFQPPASSSSPSSPSLDARAAAASSLVVLVNACTAHALPRKAGTEGQDRLVRVLVRALGGGGGGGGGGGAATDLAARLLAAAPPPVLSGLAGLAHRLWHASLHPTRWWPAQTAAALDAVGRVLRRCDARAERVPGGLPCPFDLLPGTFGGGGGGGSAATPPAPQTLAPTCLAALRRPGWAKAMILLADWRADPAGACTFIRWALWEAPPVEASSDEEAVAPTPPASPPPRALASMPSPAAALADPFVAAVVDGLVHCLGYDVDLEPTLGALTAAAGLATVGDSQAGARAVAAAALLAQAAAGEVGIKEATPAGAAERPPTPLHLALHQADKGVAGPRAVAACLAVACLASGPPGTAAAAVGSGALPPCAWAAAGELASRLATARAAARASAATPTPHPLPALPARLPPPALPAWVGVAGADLVGLADAAATSAGEVRVAAGGGGGGGGGGGALMADWLEWEEEGGEEKEPDGGGSGQTPELVYSQRSPSPPPSGGSGAGR